MKPTLRILLCLTLLPLLLGCTGHRRYATLLDKAEQANRVGRSLTIERTKANVTKGEEFNSIVSRCVKALFRFSFTAIVSPFL